MDNAYSAQRIKARGKEQGVSVAAMLAQCEIRKSLIYDMEKRDWTPSVEVFSKIADYLDCSVDYLLGRTDNPEVNK